MKKMLVLSIVMILLLSGCNRVDDYHIDNGVDEMGEQLLTKAEFLQKVSEHEEVLGVTVADFDDMDVNYFIIDLGLSESWFHDGYISGSLNFRAFFEDHIIGLPLRNIDSYRPTELRIVDSTDSEFEEFVAEYIRRLGDEANVTRHNTSMPAHYSFEDDIRRAEVTIFPTADIDYFIENQRWEFVVPPGYVRMPGAGFSHLQRPIFISQNGKFFVIFYNGPFTESVVRTFIEIYD